MEWPPWIGRRRPLEEDALRILTVVHQLGRPVRAAGFSSRLDGESRLQHLDHLVRHPVDLAFALMLSVASTDRRRPAAAREVRSLLPVPPGDPNRPRALTLHRFDHGSWERWDDVWAYLGCRSLLRVRPDGEPPSDLAYLLTDEAAAHLESLYLSEKGLAPYVERCRILGKHLPRPDREPMDGALDLDLPGLARRLDAYRREERLAAEEDLLSRLFQTTFGEPL